MYHKWEVICIYEQKRSKLEFIQSLRGLAALIVVISHVNGQALDKVNFSYLFGFFSPGWAGVDFFFVLSGFIIFYIHSKDIGEKSRVGSFLYKRVTRIYPIYLIITLLLIPIYFIIPSFGQGYEKDLGFIISSLLLVPHNHNPILTVGWSLSYEMFFYLIFALIIIIKPKISFLLLSLWIFLISLNIAGLIQSDSLATNFILSAYNLEFLMGCLAAYIVSLEKFKIRSGVFLIFGVTLFLAFWVLSLLSYIEKASDLSRFGFGVASLFIIIGAASVDMNQQLKFPKMLIRLGDASYSIYLIHFPFQVISFKIIASLYSSSNELVLFLLSTLIVIVSLLLGYLLYLLVENPILIWSKKKARRPKKTKEFSSDFPTSVGNSR